MARGTASSTEMIAPVASSQIEGQSFSRISELTGAFWMMLRPKSPPAAWRRKSRYCTTSGRFMPSRS